MIIFVGITGAMGLPLMLNDHQPVAQTGEPFKETKPSAKAKAVNSADRNICLAHPEFGYSLSNHTFIQSNF